MSQQKFEERVPEPWASALIEAGFVMQRATEPTPSRAALAAHLGLSATTIGRLMSGQFRSRGPRPAVIEAVAKALGRPADEVASWVNVPWTEVPDEWVLPPEAKLLSIRERIAVEQLIAAIAAEKKKKLAGGASPDPRDT